MQSRFFKHRRTHLESNTDSWDQKLKIDSGFDEVLDSYKLEGRCMPRNSVSEAIYDIVTSGGEELSDYGGWSTPRSHTIQHSLEDLNIRKRRISSFRRKKRIFMKKSRELDVQKKKSYSKVQSSWTSKNSCNNWKKHDETKYYCQTIISDISSDEESNLCEMKLDKGLKGMFQRHKLPENSSYRNHCRKSILPKKNSVKYSRNKKVQKNHSHLKENGNHIQTSQRNTCKQIISMKDKVALKHRNKVVSSIKKTGTLPKMTHVKKLKVQNQGRIEFEYFIDCLEEDFPVPSLCSNDKNDASLMDKNLPLSEKGKNIFPILLPFNKSSLSFFASEQVVSSPPIMNLSYSDIENVKTSTPIKSRKTRLSFSPSPLKSSNVPESISSLKIDKNVARENDAGTPKSSALFRNIPQLSSKRRKMLISTNSHISRINDSLPQQKTSEELNKTSSAKNAPLQIQSTSKHKNSLERMHSLYNTEIGFPNPTGTNKCWMNSSLQVILGMKPFIEDVMNSFQISNILESRGRYSTLLEKFIDTVKARKVGDHLQLTKNLKELYESLGVLNAHFTTNSQEDAVEFLTQFFNALREEFARLRCNSKTYPTVGEFSILSSANHCQQDQNSNTTSDINNTKHLQNNEDNQLNNPINENIVFRLKEIRSCVTCAKHNSKELENITLIVNIPSETFKGVTLQEALEKCMETETRELKCVNCGSLKCKVETIFTLLPRFLILHVNRFRVQHNIIKKLCNYIKIPVILTLKNMVNETDIVMPLQWMSAGRERFSRPEERGSPSLQDNSEAVEFQHAVQHNVTNSKFVNTRLHYKLLAIVSHKGDTPYSGHYEADVYNIKSRKWSHYNDEIVSSSTEEQVTGLSQQRNGYAFMYMYMPLFNQFTKPHEGTLNDVMNKTK